MFVWAAEVCNLRHHEGTFANRCTIVLRDVRDRGRDIDGIIKQWFAYVKPSFTRYVDPQRGVSGKKNIHSSYEP